jgi:pimeloyl-ACP methyl ester carboxylesterase
MAPWGAFFMRVYYVNGLGVDSSVFKELHVAGITPEFLEWLPLDSSETMASYARKMIEHYGIPSNGIVVGLSFGGMLAQEMQVSHPNLRIILISSSIGRHGFPWYLKWFLFLRIYRLIPGIFITTTNFIGNWLFGVSSPKDRERLKVLFRKMDSLQVKRMIHCITTWNPSPAVISSSIHGEKDRLLYPQKHSVDLIFDAGHFAVFTHANEVSRTLEHQLKELITSPKSAQEPLSRKQQDQ